MITMKELLKSAKLEDQSPTIQANLKILLEKINRVRLGYALPMTPTNSLRTWEHHTRIYKDKAAKKEAPFLNGVYDESKVPKLSKHLFGQAVDIADPKGELAAWCRANEKLLLEIGLWLENVDYTKGWVHFQIVPYGSWKPGKSLEFIPG